MARDIAVLIKQALTGSERDGAGLIGPARMRSMICDKERGRLSSGCYRQLKEREREREGGRVKVFETLVVVPCGAFKRSCRNIIFVLSKFGDTCRAN